MILEFGLKVDYTSYNIIIIITTILMFTEKRCITAAKPRVVISCLSHLVSSHLPHITDRFNLIEKTKQLQTVKYQFFCLPELLTDHNVSSGYFATVVYLSSLKLCNTNYIFIRLIETLTVPS